MCSTIPPNSRAIHMLFGKECMHMFNVCINLQLHTKIQHYILRRYQWFYFPSILFFFPQMLFTCRSRPQQDLYIDAEIKRLRMMFYCSSWTYNYKDVLWHAALSYLPFFGTLIYEITYVFTLHFAYLNCCSIPKLWFLNKHTS